MKRRRTPTKKNHFLSSFRRSGLWHWQWCLRSHRYTALVLWLTETPIMLRFQNLKFFVNQRLNAALEEIFEHFERTIVEYEEDLDRRQRELVDAVSKPEVTTGHQETGQLLVSKAVNFSEPQQQWSSRLDQEYPEPPLIKDEEEELWPSPEQAEPGSKLDSDVILPPQTGIKLSDTPEPETDDSDDWVAPPHTQPGLQPEMHPEGERSTACSESAETTRNPLMVDYSYYCAVCGKRFSQRTYLKRHMGVHTEEKLFSCSFCCKRFRQHPDLVAHVRMHTGEKPYRCTVCHKRFRYSGHVSRHMKTHKDMTTFTCSICGKNFKDSDQLAGHMKDHGIF